MQKIGSGQNKSASVNLTYVAVMAASLTVLKLALSFIPNVEAVTLLIICYASTFGARRTMTATMIFCTVEILLYGFGSWVILYYIYWNALAFTAALCLKKPSPVVAVVVAVVFTAFFGVLSTAIDVMFAGVNGVPKSELGYLFSAYYIRGAWFYIVHVVSNFCIVTVLYLPVTVTLYKILGKDISAFKSLSLIRKRFSKKRDSKQSDSKRLPRNKSGLTENLQHDIQNKDGF